MEIEFSLNNGNMLTLSISFDDLVEDYAPEFIEAFKRRLSVLDELPKVIEHMYEVISIIRQAKTPKDAEANLVKNLGINTFTAERVLSMPLSKLTALTVDDVHIEKDYIITALKS